MPSQKEAKLEVVRENRLARFWRETIAELRKVVWPTREQAMNLTVIVVMTVAVMSVFLGAVDYIFTQLIRFIVAR